MTYPYKGEQRVIDFRYFGGKFRVASEPLRSFKYVKSFKQLEYTELFKVNKNHKIVRSSKYASFVKQKDYTYGSRKHFRLSTSATKWNSKGPQLKYGQKVRLCRVYFSYKGTDAYTGKRIYEVSVNGKKGWFKESSDALFVDYGLSSSDTIDIYDAVFSDERSMSISEFADKIGAALKQEETKDEEEDDWGSFVITEKTSIDVSGFHYEDTDTAEYDGSYGGITVENTGNGQISFAGVAIGMSVDAVRFALGSHGFSYSRDGKTITVVMAAEVNPLADDYEEIPYEVFTVNLSGKKTVSSYEYHYWYDTRD